MDSLDIDGSYLRRQMGFSDGDFLLEGETGDNNVTAAALASSTPEFSSWEQDFDAGYFDKPERCFYWDMHAISISITGGIVVNDALLSK